MVISYKNKSIVLLSDTHGKHRNLPKQKADIIIHAGDACTDGNIDELNDFFNWLKEYPATHKIFIAGNHELLFEFEPDIFKKMLPPEIIFLDNNTAAINGIHFLSLAARPWLLSRPELVKPQHKIDFLLTHGPPENILDNNTGCKLLAQFVKKYTPVYHVFGHIHEQGQKLINNKKTIFINASIFHNV
jgi:Icc-related predicted phosphoesterase